MKILGIETSCDETSAAVVVDGIELKSNILMSQESVHSQFGGIVPEVAAREHTKVIFNTVQNALDRAETTLQEINAIAVTSGPGLAGSLLVGVNFAKGLAVSANIPLIEVHHIDGHIHAAWLNYPQLGSNPQFPFVCMIASGGHTELILMKDHGVYKKLGQTLDDAAGEAFDKIGRLLGLGFPGGPKVEAAAQKAKEEIILPRAWLKGTSNFSFSGLKTATLQTIQKFEKKEQISSDKIASIARAFQNSVVEVLVKKTVDVCDNYNANGIIIGGGVAANKFLRDEMIAKSNIPVFCPELKLCTDNAAMIASAGYFKSKNHPFSPINFDIFLTKGLGK